MKSGGKSTETSVDATLPPLQVQLRQLSRTLRVPQALADNAFRNYTDVQANYVLTGSPMEWLACALYFSTPHDPVKGNHTNLASSFMSLANFLMQFDMSFDTFMTKCDKWVNMNSSNTERMIGVLRDHHRAYTVSKLIFRSFDDMFWKLFNDSNSNQDTLVDAKLQEAKNAVAKKKPPAVPDSKKPPSVEEIFQLTWGLFCYVRRDEGKVKDSVLSNTLLLVCIEHVIQDVLACGHEHLLNKEFESFPPALFEETGTVEIPGLLETLCERFQGMVGEARAIKANWLQPRLAAMIERETLRGDLATCTGLLRAENLAWNVHGVFAMYYESNEKVHGYDELQFLRLPRRFGECKIQFDVKLRPVEIKSAKKGKGEVATIKMERAESSMHGTVQAGKGVLEALDAVFTNVSSLQELLNGCSRAPSSNLMQVFEECSSSSEEETSVQTRVDQHVRACITKFREHHSESDDMTKVESQEDVAVMLYYKLLEGIVMDEKRRMTSAGIALALAQDVLHHALLAACFEIVLFSTHDTTHRFPWVLNTLSLTPYNFFRIIELIIRVEPDLSRDVTSHLSKVEEQILESMAWMDSSPLWDKLYPNGQHNPVPSCAEAFLPGQLEAIGRHLSSVMKKVETSDLIHLSPVPSSTAFRDPQSKAPEQAEADQNRVEPSEGTLKASVLPRKANHSSVDIFFRKFYSLAFVRLNCFGELLDMKRNDLIQKTWTCFEHAIKSHTQIMRGRHMDQILMCCIYIMCKATGYDLKFEEIMKCYRTQRNAASHIYRSVLIKNADKEAPPPTPVEVPGENMEDRGDIIQFYNAVFLETMGGFAEQFCETTASQENSRLLLSPVPKLHSLTVSPRKRISNKFRVYVSPLNPSLKPPSLSPNRIQFQLTLDQRFPPKNVQAINSFVGQTRATSSLAKSPMKPAQKRLLTDEPAPVLAGGEKFAKKLRQAQILLPPPPAD